METAVNCDEEEKWECEEEEEEEALSLCDLPVNLIKEENQVQPGNYEDGESQAIKTEEDFNFGSWGGSLSTEPQMCAADEVFFKGQILPLRLSVSSDSGLTGFRQDSQNTSRCLSRSESMDHGSLSRFTSISSSSRSSSTRSSHYSIGSSNSITVTARNFNSNSKSNSNSSSTSNSKSKPIKIRNNFNTHPSPKPQIRLSKTRPVNVSSRNQKTSMWDFFRLGLVRAPELELQDLKVRSNNNNANRNSVSRNSSCNSSNSSSSTKNSTSKIVNNSGEVARNQQDLNKGFLEKRIGLFSGCKCSVNAVETIPLNHIAVIKSDKNNEKEKAMLYAAMEEKKKLLQELKIMKKMKEKEKKQEGKQALSRHRTFEWLKELSHASYVDEA
ncbi:PREDICTED: probable serine/threonine-protein kinase DDB_G0272282 [Theobroma cacao]|uniref:Probable serine/threonine-protein kinase DDB_G0272282 n=1 Tax=Theobroma cacao TaxID=3641 RepID=A0AB32VPC7_THECC|nr:PREDICTED: probable serine/threonine-protein kinase DDB_G0272282 [Theobroma cacao]